jgi:hypothetical protein
LVDLFIFNPAFAFLKGSASSDEAVKSFLRFELTPFLKKMRAGAIIVHHVPKPPRRGTAKRSASTSMYSPHGSAEWTNAPRGVITIEPTNSTTVFEFTIGKRGSNSGWEADEEGYYVRYFSWAAPKSVPMMWHPATEEEIAAATAENPVTDSEITDLFTAKTPDLSRSQIVAGLSANGFVIAEHRIEDLLNRLVSKGKLAQWTAANGETIYCTSSAAKKQQKEKQNLETVFGILRQARTARLTPTEIRKEARLGTDPVKKCLDELVNQNRAGFEQTGAIRRYFALPPPPTTPPSI